MIIRYIWLWQIIEQILKSPTEGALYFLNSLRAGLRCLCSLNWTSRVSYPPQCSQHVCLRLSHKLSEPESSSCWVNFNHSYSECQSSGTLLMLHHFFCVALSDNWVGCFCSAAHDWGWIMGNFHLEWLVLCFLPKSIPGLIGFPFICKAFITPSCFVQQILNIETMFFFNAPPQWRM